MENNSKRRNVLVIMCDQLRPDFLHAYGADFIPTPNIDALAAEGVVYDNAITASTVCAPARQSFFTGKNVSGHDSWTNGIPLKAGCEVLPERLNAAGYMTVATGIFDHVPQNYDHGYKYRKVITGKPEHCDYCKYIREKHPEQEGLFPTYDTGYFKYSEEEYYDRWTADSTVEFIETYTKTGKAPNGAAPENEDAPFFLYCGFNCPHGPYAPPKEVAGVVDEDKIPDILIQERPDEDIPAVELYRRAFLNPTEVVKDPHALDEERKRERVLYCEMIAEVDALVGRIVRSLKDNGIYENTTIIFTSDHGSCENDYNVMTKGPWPYKPQLFIPMIISNHPALQKGTRCDALCGNLDIGGTVLDIAGDHREFGVSRSMLGLATGEVEEREVNLSEFGDSCKTLVDKRYTFTYYPFSDKTCLFDRINDPEEKVNLGGRPEYIELERKFMMHIVDFMILAKGVRIEAHDLTKEIYDGIARKHPKFLDSFDIAYPIRSWSEVERLENLGLDATYNEFCKEREIKAHYGVYFHEERPEKQ